MKRYVHLGDVNGWDDKMNDIYDIIIGLMKQDSSYKTQKLDLGRCVTEYHHSTDKFEISYRVDSSD